MNENIFARKSKKILDILKDKFDNNWYGSVEVIIQDGRPKRVDIRESIKLPDEIE